MLSRGARPCRAHPPSVHPLPRPPVSAPSLPGLFPALPPACFYSGFSFPLNNVWLSPLPPLNLSFTAHCPGRVQSPPPSPYQVSQPSQTEPLDKGVRGTICLSNCWITWKTCFDQEWFLPPVIIPEPSTVSHAQNICDTNRWTNTWMFWFFSASCSFCLSFLSSPGDLHLIFQNAEIQ